IYVEPAALSAILDAAHRVARHALHPEVWSDLRVEGELLAGTQVLDVELFTDDRGDLGLELAGHRHRPERLPDLEPGPVAGGHPGRHRLAGAGHLDLQRLVPRPGVGGGEVGEVHALAAT